MNYNKDHMERIERYIDGDMDVLESTEFEQQLATDPELIALVKREQLIVDGVRQYGLEKDILFLRKLETSLSKEPSRNVSTPWYYAAAAAVVLLLGSYWVFMNQNPTPDELFESYFKPYPGLSDAATRGANEGDLRKQAIQAYENGNYSQAVTLLENQLKLKSDPELILLLGNTNLILGNTEDAKRNFVTLSQDYDVLDVQARWYLSLCYLKEGNVEKAREELRELSATEISYAEKAKELLRKVD